MKRLLDETDSQRFKGSIQRTIDQIEAESKSDETSSPDA